MLIPGDIAADGLLPGGGQPGGRVERQVVANRVFKPKFPPVIRVFGRLPGLFVLCGAGC